MSEEIKHRPAVTGSDLTSGVRLARLADAIDLLEADVAAVKAKVEQRDAAILQRDAAIRERDEARAEVEKMRMQLAACGVLADCNTTDSLERSRQMHPDYDCASVQSVIRAVEREIGLRAEVERLRAELAARPPDGNSPEIPDSSPAAPQPAGWLTDEERHILGAHLQSLREQRRAMERGGQTLGYSANPCAIKREADVIDNLLARAGSPPVVEVPPFENYAPEVLHLRYRDAINRAGVKWKEVGRE